LPAVKLVKYSPGMNIWIDRAYYNKKNDNKINNLYIIKHQRHNHKDIIIKSKKKINIIRVLCMLNDNSNYNDWKKLNYNLLIIGGSCIHDEVVSKEYKAGSIIIPPGGLVASDPIFIDNLNSLSEIEIKIKN
jgi:predicted acetyltransferase